MTKEILIKIPIYTGYLRVIISDDFEHVCKKYDVDLDAADTGAFVFTEIIKGGHKFSIVLKPNASNGYIVHESVHLCSNIYDIHGIKPDIHNDEPQAYLTEWLYEQIEKVLLRHREENKKTE